MEEINISFIGKKGNPFPVGKHPGRYFFISETDLKKLDEINEACKNKGLKHLKEIKIVGRGGVVGNKPFLLRAPEGGFLDGRYLCIIAEHAVEFEDVQKGYEQLIIKEEEVREKAEEKEEEIIRKREEGKYVYCVVKSGEEMRSFGDIGIENTGEVYTIPYKEFAAVVSDSPMKEYEAREENVKEHEEIARKILLEGHTVLPVAFNMVFKDKRTLLVTMSKARKALRKAYETVDKKVELGIKAIFSKDALKTIEKSRDEFVKEFESDLLKTIDGKFASSKKLDLFSDRLALNMAFLIDRDKIEEFSEAIEPLYNKYDSLKIQYSGPWTPYNFVDIRILGRGGG
ncbi:MAG: GvpL/GvpF family gas vesicle protein [Methanomicrobia archaeon]|nr:GvpL/GvpF family gas vesicle protein [Methanomicrobia archaeon]